VNKYRRKGSENISDCIIKYTNKYVSQYTSEYIISVNHPCLRRGVGSVLSFASQNEMCTNEISHIQVGWWGNVLVGCLKKVQNVGHSHFQIASNSA